MNRVWMITGAGRGLGRAFAEEAVKNGDMVIATVRNKRPVARDDDNPELTDEQLASLRKMQEKRSAGCRR